MKLFSTLLRIFLLALLSACLHGCASESELTAIRLGNDNPLYNTDACQKSIKYGEMHRVVKSVRSIFLPVLVVMRGGLLLPLFAANVGLDSLDHVDASNMADRCGDKGKTGGEITQRVAKGASLGLLRIVSGLPGQ